MVIKSMTKLCGYSFIIIISFTSVLYMGNGFFENFSVEKMLKTVNAQGNTSKYTEIKHRIPSSATDNRIPSESTCRLFPIEITKKERVLWKDDPECSNVTVNFGKGIEHVLLQSYPRSGNTWIRYLLEGATGIFSGSVYVDGSLAKMGFIGENQSPNSDRVLFIKTHAGIIYNMEKMKIKKDYQDIKTVLLLRNPFKALKSFFEYKNARGNVHLFAFKNKEELLERKEAFRRSAIAGIDVWQSLAIETLVWMKSVHVVHYEDLVLNPIQEIRKILSFIGMTPNEHRLTCLAKHTQGSFKRNSTDVDLYDFETKLKIHSAIKSLDSLLLERNFKPMEHYDLDCFECTFNPVLE